MDITLPEEVIQIIRGYMQLFAVKKYCQEKHLDFSKMAEILRVNNGILVEKSGGLRLYFPQVVYLKYNNFRREIPNLLSVGTKRLHCKECYIDSNYHVSKLSSISMCPERGYIYYESLGKIIVVMNVSRLREIVQKIGSYFDGSSWSLIG